MGIFECPSHMLLCLSMFVSLDFALPLLLSLSAWTISQGGNSPGCYLCVIRHCTAEPYNTLLLIQPAVRVLPS